MGVKEADTMEVEAAVMMGVEEEVVTMGVEEAVVMMGVEEVEAEAEVIAEGAVEAVINQACCPWRCRGCHGTPRFWQIS